MSKVSLKGQAVPLVFLLLLLAAAVVSTATHERLKRGRHTFSIEHYERLMHRIDVAISSISDTMIEEGMAADFEELLSRAGTELDEEALLPEPVDERVVLELTGVVWNPRMPLAFINGLTVGKGDRVGDAEIIHIGKETVSVRYPDKTEKTLTLTPDDE
ncbi:MAG: hypothetical protein HN919_22310 [Verrucomicrobia bacterium]|jgi:hypothetical protein|nr:hypothetical protein [Verrucomicrobiota bacterium]MBT7069046.1 hypothetical protein [Verrucomicrobiota bacterium]MBT7702219.1 hypothetical protein [Verrucomicrobiota bacterium]